MEIQERMENGKRNYETTPWMTENQFFAIDIFSQI